jgi:anti-sigma factor RsiW
MNDHLDHRRVDAFLDGELLEPDAPTVRAHLASCEPCRRLVSQAQALVSAIGQPIRPLPAGFAARTRERAFGRRLPAAPLWWLGLPQPLRLGLAALLAVSVLAGARLGRTVHESRSPAAELAAALDSPATSALLAEAGTASLSGEARR